MVVFVFSATDVFKTSWVIVAIQVVFATCVDPGQPTYTASQIGFMTPENGQKSVYGSPGFKTYQWTAIFM